MPPFQKNIAPNHLSIDGIYSLYKNLERGIKGKNPKTYLVDEVLEMLDGIDTESFKASLRILYGDRIDYGSKSPLDLVLLLVEGLKENKAFEFFDFVRIISSGVAKR